MDKYTSRRVYASSLALLKLVVLSSSSPQSTLWQPTRLVLSSLNQSPHVCSSACAATFVFPFFVVVLFCADCRLLETFYGLMLALCHNKFIDLNRTLFYFWLPACNLISQPSSAYFEASHACLQQNVCESWHGL